ncbi:MAG TPA: ribbon-helix-helix protein, CopG family [Solirubrobacteraceae bacterium]|jgi:Arc/MetJ-type ribon-helix-helix transcriptional regulator|nr:ribbon-helix-helix protein, CopG family [Solirubrobacteraceae bacterium]
MRKTADDKRLSVVLSPDEAAALRELVDGRAMTRSEAVRKAIRVLKFVLDEEALGHTIQSTDPANSRTRELVLV